MLGHINDLLSKWEPSWLYFVLHVETLIGLVTMIICIKTLRYERKSTEWLEKEYQYDADKDLAKKQRRTRTTKKVTTQPSGESTTEETTEVTEPSGEQK